MMHEPKQVTSNASEPLLQPPSISLLDMFRRARLICKQLNLLIENSRERYRLIHTAAPAKLPHITNR